MAISRSASSSKDKVTPSVLSIQFVGPRDGPLVQLGVGICAAPSSLISLIGENPAILLPTTRLEKQTIGRGECNTSRGCQSSLISMDYRVDVSIGTTVAELSYPSGGTGGNCEKPFFFFLSASTVVLCSLSSSPDAVFTRLSPLSLWQRREFDLNGMESR